MARAINGYDYDVIGDRDLHSNPSILSNYRTVFIVGHSEYWSREGWSAIRSYLASGGNVIVASGNTMFWRVSFDDSVIECRKKGQADGGERPNAQWGELYHEHDHQRGGLMREAGCPAWQAIGLESVGYDGTHVPYKVTEPTHPFFQRPEAIARARRRRRARSSEGCSPSATSGTRGWIDPRGGPADAASRLHAGDARRRAHGQTWTMPVNLVRTTIS